MVCLSFGFCSTFSMYTYTLVNRARFAARLRSLIIIHLHFKKIVNEIIVTHELKAKTCVNENESKFENET